MACYGSHNHHRCRYYNGEYSPEGNRAPNRLDKDVRSDSLRDEDVWEFPDVPLLQPAHNTVHRNPNTVRLRGATAKFDRLVV
jgi:hypothetical protein